MVIALCLRCLQHCNTNAKPAIKRRQIMEQNLPESNPIDYEANPVPAREFFAVTLQTKQFILDNF